MSAEKQVISIDGAYVPLVKGQWAEVRTVAIGEVKKELTVQGQREVHACHLSYFSRMTHGMRNVYDFPSSTLQTE
jgi:hypothetical protein